MTFIDEIIKYVDSDGLIGSEPNPTPVSNGNPLTLAGIAACIDPEIGDYLVDGVLKLQCQEPFGIWNKKARSADQVTHDDLIGLVAFSVQSDFQFHKTLVRFGTNNNWLLSNTGEFYFTALAKPWHRAFYLMAAEQDPGHLLKLCLFFNILADACVKGSASGKQLMWLQVKCIKGKSKLIDYAISKWWIGIKNTWGSMKNVLSDYHGADHPFVKWCMEREH